MFKAGWAKAEIELPTVGYAMHGYGQPSHKAKRSETPLYARTIVLYDALGKSLIWTCLDTGYVTFAMRSKCIEILNEQSYPGFDENTFVLTCTHTHSGPGGCSTDVLYNLVTPGHQPVHLNAVVNAVVQSVQTAHHQCQPSTLYLGQKAFTAESKVAWNRALSAWNSNLDTPKYQPHDCHKAVDREMQVLSIQGANGVQAFISLFGVHATCLGNQTDSYNGDNKGYAAAQAEAILGDQAVAIFSQGTAGDISPHYHGPNQMAQRRVLTGKAERDYAFQNGLLQSQMALSILNQDQTLQIEGQIDGILSYFDFARTPVDPKFAGGRTDAWTSEPCLGMPFFRGTPVDGHGIHSALAVPLTLATRALRRWRSSPMFGLSKADRTYYQRLYGAQGNKDILIECGRKLALGRPLCRLGLPDWVDPLVAELNRQGQAGAFTHSAMVPTVLPLQIVTLGRLAIVCCPGEFTTTAGRRLREQIQALLEERDVQQTLICTYCNDYMGYVTTQEEYQVQTYEGGHTLFGQWTLGAFQTQYQTLVEDFLQPKAVRDYNQKTKPHPVPHQELNRRSHLPPRD